MVTEAKLGNTVLEDPDGYLALKTHARRPS